MKYLIVSAALCCCVFLGMALRAGAQVTAHVDETGKRIFINAEPPGKAAGVLVKAVAVRVMPTLSGVPPADNHRREELQRLVVDAADRHQLDPALIAAMISHESNWNPRAVSRKGAQGLMQLMPSRARMLGVTDIFDPAQNINAGVRYFRWLLERYSGDLDKALAGYNAGEGAVDRAGGVPNFTETRNYVQRISDAYFSPNSGRRPHYWSLARAIYRLRDERGKLIFTNE